MEEAPDFADQTPRPGGGSRVPHLHAVPGYLGQDSCVWSPHEPVRRVALPLLLIDLNNFTIRAASSSMHSLNTRQLVGRPWSEVVAANDRGPVETALEALKSGAIDVGRRRSGPAHHGDGNSPHASFVARRTDLDDRRFALVFLDSGRRRDPVSDYLGSTTSTIGVGTIDSSWRITSLSEESTDLVGRGPHEIIGQLLVAPHQQHYVPRSGDIETENGDSSLALEVCLNDSFGRERRMCCLVTPLVTGRGRVFLLIPDLPDIPTGETVNRVAQLEQHLWTIAGVIQDSGILQYRDLSPQLVGSTQLDGLSTRQWEVLSRLVRGERVPTIASALFVSQSTVRNYLSALFKRFGVHSQAQLLAVLANQDTSPVGAPDVTP